MSVWSKANLPNLPSRRNVIKVDSFLGHYSSPGMERWLFWLFLFVTSVHRAALDAHALHTSERSPPEWLVTPILVQP